MQSDRQALLEWAAAGHIGPQQLRQAALLAGVIPGAGQWRRFIDLLLLFGGAVLFGAGVIFFIAYNWQDLGRYAKFALLEAGIVAALAMIARLGLERTAGKAILLGAGLMLGALLALVGQTYQTGADTYELFAAWALALLPWVLLAQFAAYWLLWLAIVNVALVFYYRAFGGWFGFFFEPQQVIWALFAINTAALVTWELLALRGPDWLRARWALRVLAFASGAAITVLAAIRVMDSDEAGVWAIPLWLAWLVAAYAVYRHALCDLFVLAGGVLSVVIVTACLLGKHLLRSDAAGGFLFIGLVVLGLSAAGGWWLRRLAEESA